jgi:hypothetical protein
MEIPDYSVYEFTAHERGSPFALDLSIDSVGTAP